MKRRLIAAIACRNQGSRLYGKPLQNLDVNSGTRILDNIIGCLKSIESIDEIVLGISEGSDNIPFIDFAKEHSLRYVVGDQKDVLSRLVQCAQIADATDVFRVTSESPFLYFESVDEQWNQHVDSASDATFMDDVIDGCNFEIISAEALGRSHRKGDARHRSELCTLYIRENSADFRVSKSTPPEGLVRKDLRLTVDNPEDLVLCRAVFSELGEFAPRIPVGKIIGFLDENPGLTALVSPFLEEGYASMYRWNTHE